MAVINLYIVDDSGLEWKIFLSINSKTGKKKKRRKIIATYYNKSYANVKKKTRKPVVKDSEPNFSEDCTTSIKF